MWKLFQFLVICSFISSKGLQSMKSLITNFRNLSESVVYEIPVKGSSSHWNYYFIDIFIGESKKKQSYLLDTSTSFFTSPCSPYSTETGEHLNNYFDVKDDGIIICDTSDCFGKCNQKKQCSFSFEDISGSSIEGIYSKQLILFSQNEPINNGAKIIMGCTVKETKLFYYQKVDGILGLANSKGK